LFGGSVYGQEEVKKEYWDNGKLMIETHYKNGKQEDNNRCWGIFLGLKDIKIMN